MENRDRTIQNFSYFSVFPLWNVEPDWFISLKHHKLWINVCNYTMLSQHDVTQFCYGWCLSVAYIKCYSTDYCAVSFMLRVFSAQYWSRAHYAEDRCTECQSTDDFKTCVAPYLTLLSSWLFELIDRLLFLLREATEINWLHASSLTEGERVIKNYLSGP